ncbi:MAG: AbrB/MazE/SpoVT family DNA-binding domain-containing protein [Chloroflexota bacterium]
MKTTIDAGGRVVVPKPIRNALQLVAGAALEISERGGVIVIEPRPRSMRLVRRGQGVAVEADDPLPTLTADMVRDTLDSVRR